MHTAEQHHTSNIVNLEAQLDQQLQRPRVTNLDAVRQAAMAWLHAVWSATESAGPPILTGSEIEHTFAVARRLVFVFGVHRSGTMLVRDTNFAWHLKRLELDGWLQFLGCEWLRMLANPINQHPHWLLGRSSAEGSLYSAFARALLAWWPLVGMRRGPRTTSWPLVAIAPAYAHCTTGFRTAPLALGRENAHERARPGAPAGRISRGKTAPRRPPSFCGLRIKPSGRQAVRPYGTPAIPRMTTVGSCVKCVCRTRRRLVVPFGLRRARTCSSAMRTCLRTLPAVSVE